MPRQVEKVMNKLKNKILIISFLLAGLLITSLTGCGKKEIHRGGDDQNFPYTWQEKNKGTILVSLDGNYGASDYQWVPESEDEEILIVEKDKKEKDGISYFKIVPVSEGTCTVRFKRARNVESETAGETDTKDRATRIFKEKFVEKDELCDIMFRVNVTGSKGKFRTEVLITQESEYKGATRSEDESFDYTFWSDEGKDLIVKLSGDDWEPSWEGEYTPEERQEIPGLVFDEPETDEGIPKILEIENGPYTEGVRNFRITGFAKGKAEITFKNPDGRTLTLSVEIGDSGAIEVLSHNITK